MLAALRIKVLEYENQNAEPCDWLISFDDIRALLATGAGFLTASNDEEGMARKITSMISRMRTYGYLAPTEDDDMYVLTPLVPWCLTGILLTSGSDPKLRTGAYPPPTTPLPVRWQDDDRHRTRRIRFQHRRQPFR